MYRQKERRKHNPLLWLQINSASPLMLKTCALGKMVGARSKSINLSPLTSELGRWKRSLALLFLCRTTSLSLPLLVRSELPQQPEAPGDGGPETYLGRFQSLPPKCGRLSGRPGPSGRWRCAARYGPSCAGRAGARSQPDCSKFLVPFLDRNKCLWN